MYEKDFEFLVQGSEDHPYSVTFTKSGNKLSATCSCRAGIMGQLCKHRLSIMSGDATRVVSENSDQVAQIPHYLIGTETENLIKAVSQLEREKKILEDNLKRLKKKIIQSLS